MNYNELTRRHFESPVAVGVLSGARVRRGVAGDPARGTWVQFDVRLGQNDERLRRVDGRLGQNDERLRRVDGRLGQDDVRLGPGDEESLIEAVCFLAFGCPHVIAVADWIAHTSVGRRPEAALPESVAALRERFDVPVAKLGRLLIVEDAWIAAFAPPS